MLNDLKWLKSIEARMQSVPEKYRHPDLGDVAPNEEVIGTVPEALLPMQYLIEQLHDELQQATEALELVHAQEGDCKPFHDAAKTKDVEFKNMRSFFSCLLRAELDLPIRYERLATRNGNKVVTWERENPMSMLEKLLGDGRVKVIPMGGMPGLGLGSRGD